MSKEEIEVLGVTCFWQGGRDGCSIWRGGMSKGARAQPDEAWIAVHVEQHKHGDAEHWIVVRKVSYRSGDPDVWGAGTRHKARFRFEGHGATLDDAELECGAAEDWLKVAGSE